MCIKMPLLCELMQSRLIENISTCFFFTSVLRSRSLISMKCCFIKYISLSIQQFFARPFLIIWAEVLKQVLCGRIYFAFYAIKFLFLSCALSCIYMHKYQLLSTQIMLAGFLKPQMECLYRPTCFFFLCHNVFVHPFKFLFSALFHFPYDQIVFSFYLYFKHLHSMHKVFQIYFTT